jgi:hypothetical protein
MRNLGSSDASCAASISWMLSISSPLRPAEFIVGAEPIHALT